MPSPAPQSSSPGPGTARCVVVGYDMSPESERALTWALRRAGSSGRVVLVHGRSGGEGLAEEQAIAEVPFLERRDVYEAEVVSVVDDAGGADAILRAADDHHADEIAVGHRGRGRLRSLTGGVCAELLQRSTVPVIVVPPGADPR